MKSLLFRYIINANRIWCVSWSVVQGVVNKTKAHIRNAIDWQMSLKMCYYYYSFFGCETTKFRTDLKNDVKVGWEKHHAQNAFTHSAGELKKRWITLFYRNRLYSFIYNKHVQYFMWRLHIFTISMITYLKLVYLCALIAFACFLHLQMLLVFMLCLTTFTQFNFFFCFSSISLTVCLTMSNVILVYSKYH